MVESVALGGYEAGVGDDAAELGFVGAVFHAGGEDNIFFDEDAADIIGAELQADLADFNARSEPAGLDVVKVVEVQTADGKRLQVIDSCGLLNFLAERGIFRCKDPGDDGGESSGVLLNSPQPVVMIHAMAELFSAAAHHCPRRAECTRPHTSAHL